MVHVYAFHSSSTFHIYPFLSFSFSLLFSIFHFYFFLNLLFHSGTIIRYWCRYIIQTRFLFLYTFLRSGGGDTLNEAIITPSYSYSEEEITTSFLGLIIFQFPTY